MRFLVVACLLSPLSALVVRAPAPKRTGDVTMQFRAKNLEERRRSKLQTGTNWPPRTDPIPGKGYFFFQGPTPKTAVQEDLPSFFSADNFAGLEISSKQLLVTATGFASAALLGSTLLAPTTTVSAPPAAPAAVSAPKAKEPEKKA